VQGHERTFSVKPPWIQYPHSDPTWGGWRQGDSEAWLLDVWLPFWRQLGPQDRQDYLKQWPAPSEEWGLYVGHFWR
jgi:hypothetical protein